MKKECSVCGGIAEKSRNIDNEPIWKCRCCDHETPRKIYNTKKRVARMAKSDEMDSLLNELLAAA